MPGGGPHGAGHNTCGAYADWRTVAEDLLRVMRKKTAEWLVLPHTGAGSGEERGDLGWQPHCLFFAFQQEGATPMSNYPTDYLVLEWMTPHPITVTPKTPLTEAGRIMKERQVRRLPVVEDGKLVGIITSGDLREAAPSIATSLSVFELNYLLEKVTVDKIMKRHVITVGPKTPIREAANVMLHKKISGLPVIEPQGERLVGIITESDIFRMLVRDMNGKVEN
jgi:CBS domain-containing protein